VDDADFVDNARKCRSLAYASLERVRLQIHNLTLVLETLQLSGVVNQGVILQRLDSQLTSFKAELLDELRAGYAEEEVKRAGEWTEFKEALGLELRNATSTADLDWGERVTFTNSLGRVSNAFLHFQSDVTGGPSRSAASAGCSSCSCSCRSWPTG
jgi:hypothetical protein